VTTFTPGDPLIAAAGDIACDPTASGFNGGAGTSSKCAEKATSDLVLANPSIAAVLALGDNQYGCGGYSAFQQSFAPTWGRFLAKIHPVAGNHEYQTNGGSDCADTAMAAITDKSPAVAQQAYQCMDPSFQQRVSEQAFTQQMQTSSMPSVDKLARVGDYHSPAGGTMVYYALDGGGQSVGYIVYLGQNGKVVKIE